MTMPTVDAFDFDTAIIGSGFSGRGMAIRLKQEGIEDFTVLERGDDVGGTWPLHHVPGLRLRRPVAPLLVLLRPQCTLERDVLAPARDPRPPAARRRRVRHSRARALRLHRHRHRVGRGHGRLDARDLARSASPKRRAPDRWRQEGHGELEVDAIIFGTGFQVTEMSVGRIVRGPDWTWRFRQRTRSFDPADFELTHRKPGNAESVTA
jgi:cation diffusion facilitator CzcD-associated flavoprotein CzcO